jgi:hypothetical protein
MSLNQENANPGVQIALIRGDFSDHLRREGA